MTDIQSSHCSSVAMNVNGIPFIRTESGPLTEDSHCTVKVLTVCGKCLVDNTVRVFNVMAPKAVNVRIKPYRPVTCAPDPQTLPLPETRAESLPVIQTAPVRDSAWWRFARRPNVNKKPNQIAMMIDFLFHGCIHLPVGHPQYEERKTLLLRKGFHFNGKRGAWVPDPNWTPEPA